MGSWSESCGFSGLEISESDDAYVMLMEGPTYSSSHGPYTAFQPKTTLIRGSYNDYGFLRVEDAQDILDIFNKQSGLDVKNGDDFSLEDLDGKDFQRFWIHAGIFEALPRLTPEDKSVYDRDTNTCSRINDIGEMLAFYADNLEKTIRDSRTIIVEYEGDHRYIQMELTLMRLSNSMVGESSSKVSRWYLKYIEDIVQSNISYQGFMEAKRRNDLLEGAAFQLRKKLQPSEGIGPQHGGHVAGQEFANIILEVQATRRLVDDEED